MRAGLNALTDACHDCGVDVDAIDELRFMLTDRTWKDAGALHASLLCIGCIERRLGRTLTSADFSNVPINTLPDVRSARLQDRLR
jgi:hypothetical protein